MIKLKFNDQVKTQLLRANGDGQQLKFTNKITSQLIMHAQFDQAVSAHRDVSG